MDEHLKPFVKDNAAEIQEGIKAFASNDLIPAAEELQDKLPKLAESFTEGQLKPGAKQLAQDIETQVTLRSEV